MPDGHRLAEDQILFLCKRDHLVKLARVEGDGLLDKEVFAVLERTLHKVVVRIVRAGDVDDVNLIVKEHLIDGVIHLLDAVLFSKGDRLVIGTVADSIELFVHLLQSARHFVSDHACTEYCPIQIFLFHHSTSFHAALYHDEGCLSINILLFKRFIILQNR